jgi:hypothetical protein
MHAEGPTGAGWWLDRAFYNLWPNLFYGGILVVVHVLALRTERMRSLLQDAAIARGRSAALRGEAELDALHRHIDPALLLDVMAEVERRYRDAPEQADELLGRLVEFLRCAMPGLKDRASTLEVEMQLALAYAQLQAVREGGASWRVVLPAALPAMPFPSQFVLPLLALAAPKAAPRLLVRCQGAAARLEARGLGRAPPLDFMQHARLSLQSLLGERFELQATDCPDPQLTLTLHPPPSEGEHHGT